MSWPAAQRPVSPAHPENALRSFSSSVNDILSLPSKPVALLNEGFATATASIAAALPTFPAATLLSFTLGLPHAHVAHPPSGPPPVPPTPLPPSGPVLLGTCVSVLINSKPAARCGDMGLNPTCCGLPPMFEIFTGSSKVFIGGSRAARVTDVTYHCKPVPPAGAASRGACAASKLAMRAAMVAKVMATAANVAGKVGTAAQGAAIVADATESIESDDSAMSAALGMAASMAAAQMAADAAAMAAGAAMGKDPCVPPGTLGAIMTGSPNVLIGGFPMPTWSAIAKGLLRKVLGKRFKGALGGAGFG